MKVELCFIIMENKPSTSTSTSSGSGEESQQHISRADKRQVFWQLEKEKRSKIYAERKAKKAAKAAKAAEKAKNNNTAGPSNPKPPAAAATKPNPQKPKQKKKKQQKQQKEDKPSKKEKKQRKREGRKQKKVREANLTTTVKVDIPSASEGFLRVLPQGAPDVAISRGQFNNLKSYLQFALEQWLANFTIIEPTVAGEIENVSVASPPPVRSVSCDNINIVVDEIASASSEPTEEEILGSVFREDLDPLNIEDMDFDLS